MRQTTSQKSWQKLPLLAFAILAIAGCSTSHGFDRGRISQSFADDDSKQITDQDIRSAMARKPQLKFPFKLAVELRERDCYQCTPWREDDKQKILAWGDQLKQAGVISEIAILPDIFEMKNLKTIRLAAAQQGADAVLIIRSADDIDRYSNYGSILYVTIVGFWIVPGTDSDALVVLRGAMYDVANAYLYATVEAEGQSHTIGPALVLEDKDALKEARRNALDNFGQEFIKHAEALAPKPGQNAEKILGDLGFEAAQFQPAHKTHKKGSLDQPGFFAD